jgi:hypothetical protein
VLQSRATKYREALRILQRDTTTRNKIRHGIEPLSGFDSIGQFRISLRERSALAVSWMARHRWQTIFSRYLSRNATRNSLHYRREWEGGFR